MWPNDDDLRFAASLGHVVNQSSLRCDCSWRPQGSSGVLPRTQAANHLWMVAHEAKEQRATGMGVELCMECKGSGTSRITDRKCDSCAGCGLLGLEIHERAAVAGGHEPVADDLCICGHEGDWGEHADLVGAALLSSLSRFEADLRASRADHRT